MENRAHHVARRAVAVRGCGGFWVPLLVREAEKEEEVESTSAAPEELEEEEEAQLAPGRLGLPSVQTRLRLEGFRVCLVVKMFGFWYRITFRCYLINNV